MAVGAFAVKSEPMMASGDGFEISVRSKGTRAAQPQKGVDVVLTAAHAVVALQQVASRTTDPLHAIVVSATQIHGGDAYNVLPDEVVVRGAETALRRVVAGGCAAAGAKCEIAYTRRYPTLINEPKASSRAESAARAVFVDVMMIRRKP